MLDVLIKLDLLLREIILISIHTNAHIARSSCPLQSLLMASLLPPHHRGEHQNLRSLRKKPNTIHHLIYCLLLNHPAALRAMGNSDSRIQEAEIIIDLRHRSHSRSRISIRRFLVDGNRRRKSFDLIHIRLLHLSEELSCIRRQRLHISSLSLGINGIKGKTGLSGSGKSGQNHQLVSRNGDIDVLQIMLPGPRNPDTVFLMNQASPLLIPLLLSLRKKFCLLQGRPVVRFLHLYCHRSFMSFLIYRLSAPANAS